MTQGKEIWVGNAVEELVHKAKESADANDALKFSQAACNVANARAAMLIGRVSEEDTG
jgi:hypothetical protein